MKYVLIAGIIILTGFILALKFIPIGIEPLTEVYFENNTALPKYVFLNRSYNFTFTIVNKEYRGMHYSYNVSLVYGNSTEQVDYKNFFLENNESVSFREDFILMKRQERYKMQVVVTKDTNETTDIHFWMEPVEGPSIIIIPN